MQTEKSQHSGQTDEAGNEVSDIIRLASVWTPMTDSVFPISHMSKGTFSQDDSHISNDFGFGKN